MLQNNNNIFNTIPCVIQRTRYSDNGVRSEISRQ